MTATTAEAAERRVRLEQQRDQALRDLFELEQQVQAGDVPESAAEALRRRYERSAAEALALLDDGEPVEAPRLRRTMTWRAGLYSAGALSVVVALAVLLPAALQERPTGGFVSGNEAFVRGPSAASTSPPGGQMSVSDTEMEEAVAANPDVVGMRLALAQRYLDQRAFDKAIPHYQEVLAREPGNAVALASLGWALFLLDDTAGARRFADAALERDPGLPLGWWVRANVSLYGEEDPQAAVAALQQMQQLPLAPEVEEQVTTLLGEALARTGTGGGSE